MNKHTDDFKNINFADFMASKGCDDLEYFFGTLSDMGVPVAISEDEFRTSEYAYHDADQLSYNLIFWGNWFRAKVAGFDAINDRGFEGVKAHSDIDGTLVLRSDFGDGSFDGEWCRNDGVIYVSCRGVVEVANASGNKRKDLKTAKFLLTALDRHLSDEGH